MATATIYDAIVESGGTYETVDAAIDAGQLSIFVKSGESLAGWTQDVQYVSVELGAAVVVTSAITISASNCELIGGPGCDVQGLITLSTGTEAYIAFANGCSLVGISLSQARGYINGGGWGTISDGGTANQGVFIGAADCLVESITADTTTGSTGEAACEADASGDRSIFRAVKVIDSEEHAFELAADELLLMGCAILGADSRGFSLTAPRSRVIGNVITDIGSDGVFIGSGGDDAVVVGNVIRDPVSDPVQIDAAGENCVVVANRLDGAINDASGTSTTSSNDTDAF